MTDIQRWQVSGKFQALFPAAAVPSGFGTTAHVGKRALLLAPEGVEREMEQAGIPFVTGEQLRLPTMDSTDAMQGLQVGPTSGLCAVPWRQPPATCARA
jgi:hypothetical protein